MIDIEKAIEYFYNQMEIGKIESDYQQEIFEIAISALEKQIAKKPVKDREYTLCPNCKKVEIDWPDYYCHGCGQRLDWSEEE